MTVFNATLLVLAVLFFSTSSAFFWGSSSQATSPPYPQYYYHQRLMQSPTGYTEPPMPAIPVQLPLQAQLAPSTVHNVQLVPCLCPVSQDYEFEKVQPELIHKDRPLKAN